MFKSGTDVASNAGRRYVIHNTALQGTQSGVSFGLGAGQALSGQGCSEALTNTVSRNNILQVWKSNWESIQQTSCGFGNDVNYDLFNGPVVAEPGAEANGINGVAVYLSGNGFASMAGGQYQLAPGTAGYGKGVSIPNFNDGIAAPDMGANQSGKPAMKFGVNGTR